MDKDNIYLKLARRTHAGEFTPERWAEKRSALKELEGMLPPEMWALVSQRGDSLIDSIEWAGEHHSVSK